MRHGMMRHDCCHPRILWKSLSCLAFLSPPTLHLPFSFSHSGNSEAGKLVETCRGGGSDGAALLRSFGLIVSLPFPTGRTDSKERIKYACARFESGCDYAIAVVDIDLQRDCHSGDSDGHIDWQVGQRKESVV